MDFNIKSFRVREVPSYNLRMDKPAKEASRFLRILNGGANNDCGTSCPRVEGILIPQVLPLTFPACCFGNYLH
jgi:hypothetical protein